MMKNWKLGIGKKGFSRGRGGLRKEEEEEQEGGPSPILQRERWRDGRGWARRRRKKFPLVTR